MISFLAWTVNSLALVELEFEEAKDTPVALGDWWKVYEVFDRRIRVAVYEGRICRFGLGEEEKGGLMNDCDVQRVWESWFRERVKRKVDAESPEKGSGRRKWLRDWKARMNAPGGNCQISRWKWYQMKIGDKKELWKGILRNDWPRKQWTVKQLTSTRPHKPRKPILHTTAVTMPFSIPAHARTPLLYLLVIRIRRSVVLTFLEER
jgi:hypothetical protein